MPWPEESLVWRRLRRQIGETAGINVSQSTEESIDAKGIQVLRQMKKTWIQKQKQEDQEKPSTGPVKDHGS